MNIDKVKVEGMTPLKVFEKLIIIVNEILS